MSFIATRNKIGASGPGSTPGILVLDRLQAEPANPNCHNNKQTKSHIVRATNSFVFSTNGDTSITVEKYVS